MINPQITQITLIQFNSDGELLASLFCFLICEIGVICGLLFLRITSFVGYFFCRREAITFAAVAPAPTAPAIVGASGFATSPIAKTLATLVSCCEPTITYPP